MPWPLIIVSVTVIVAVARPGSIDSRPTPRAREAESRSYIACPQAWARASSLSTGARLDLASACGEDRRWFQRERTGAMTVSVIHQPRVAWDGARAFVAACENLNVFPWFKA